MRAQVVEDASAHRDLTTAAALLEGAGLTTARVGTANAPLFDPAKAGFCPYPTSPQYVRAIEANLASTPKLDDADELLARMQAALGKGVAPPIPEINNTIVLEGYWEGGMYMASEWAEAFLLQYGSGIEVGYGRVSVDDVYDYMRLHTYYRAVNDRPYLIEQRGQSDLLAHMLWDLHDNTSKLRRTADARSSDAPGASDALASVYVGHDTNIDGINVLLNLTWDAAPYPRDATPPGSMLRLRADDGGVTAAFLYATFEEGSVGALTEVPALFDGVSDTVTRADFNMRAGFAIDWDCVRGTPDGEGAWKAGAAAFA